MLAHLIDLLEELIESKRVQPLGLLQVSKKFGNPLVLATPTHQDEKPTPQLLGAHRFVHHLEVNIDENIALGPEAVDRSHAGISQIVEERGLPDPAIPDQGA